MSNRALVLLVAAGALATTALADTLVLRSGRRVEGDLISVRGSTIEFAEANGSTRRYDRGDVARIELYGSRYDDGRAWAGVRRACARSTRPSRPPRQWNDTGVDVRSGMRRLFRRQRVACAGVPIARTDPAGEGGNRYNANRPIPGRPGGALVGRIGDSDPFYIGDEKGPIRMRESGRLSLGVNDDYLQDNSGSWRVTIYY